MKLLNLLAFFLVGSLCSSLAQAQDASGWLTLGGDYHRSGFANNSLIGSQLEQKWKTLDGNENLDDANVIIEASPVIGNNKVYIATVYEEGWRLVEEDNQQYDLNSSIVALDLETGRVVWTRQLGWDGIWATPTLSKDLKTLFVAAWDGKVYALDAETGAMKWNRLIASPGNRELRAAPIVHEGKVFVGTFEWGVVEFEGKLFVLDAASGEELLSKPLSGGLYSSPIIVSDQRLAVVLSRRDGNSRIELYDIRSNSISPAIWGADLRGDSLSSPVYQNGVIFHRSGRSPFSASSQDGGTLYAFDAQSGNLLVDPLELPGGGYSSPAVDNTHLYLTTTSSSLSAIEIEAYLSGSANPIRWTTTMPNNGTIAASPAIANGQVFISTDDDTDPEGAFYSIDASSGEILWSYDAGNGVGSAQASPAVAGNTVVFVSYDDNQRIDHGVFAFHSPHENCIQRPFSDQEIGRIYSGYNWNYTLGYHFSPNQDGTINQLGGFFQGTSPVYLWDRDSGELLAQAEVSSDNSWSYVDIAPVSVEAGRNYTVAGYLEGSRASYLRSSVSFPRSFEGLRILGSTWRYGFNRPTNSSSYSFYGLVDVGFNPDVDSCLFENPDVGSGLCTSSPEPFDVNSDGYVSPIDVLTVINYLNTGQVQNGYCLDTNGDSLISAVDVLGVINRINAGI